MTAFWIQFSLHQYAWTKSQKRFLLITYLCDIQQKCRENVAANVGLIPNLTVFANVSLTSLLKSSWCCSFWHTRYTYLLRRFVKSTCYRQRHLASRCRQQVRWFCGHRHIHSRSTLTCNQATPARHHHHSNGIAIFSSISSSNNK